LEIRKTAETLGRTPETLEKSREHWKNARNIALGLKNNGAADFSNEKTVETLRKAFF
jgi:hypothetical protein